MALRVAITDDEPLARARLRRLLAGEPGVVVVGETGTAGEAAALLRRTPVDLLLLDVRLPGQSGLEFLRGLESMTRPLVILVTAYDSFAVQAYDLEVIDYLLKPVRAARLSEGLRRARATIAGHRAEAAGLGRDPAPTPQPAGAAAEPVYRVLVNVGRRGHLIKMSDVEWIEAADNYVRFHVGGRHHPFRITLRRLLRRLDPTRFVRIHRSTVVNLDHVADVTSLRSGDAVVRMTSGRELRLSRSYRNSLPRL